LEYALYFGGGHSPEITQIVFRGKLMDGKSSGLRRSVQQDGRAADPVQPTSHQTEGLQLIAAVRDEKMQHMAPEVSTTLFVSKYNYQCYVDMIDRWVDTEESTLTEVAAAAEIAEEDEYSGAERDNGEDKEVPADAFGGQGTLF
jgi:hypothetical protein